MRDISGRALRHVCSLVRQAVRTPVLLPGDVVVDAPEAHRFEPPRGSPSPSRQQLPATSSDTVLPGGNRSGRVTSQPAGIDRTITLGNGAGACSVFFPVGTVVRVDASSLLSTLAPETPPESGVSPLSRRPNSNRGPLPLLVEAVREPSTSTAPVRTELGYL